MSHETGAKPTARQRLRHELRDYAAISLYLFVCFSALLFYRYTLLEGEASDVWRYSLAAGKALVVGKFILIGKALRLGERHASRTPLYRVATRSLLFLLLLLALHVVEEMVIALVHGRPVASALSESGTPLQMGATSLLMLLILIPLIFLQEMGAALGEGTLRRAFLKERRDG